MTITRRRFVQAAAATSAFTSINILHYPAGAAEFAYKYGNNVPPTYPMNVRVRVASDRIREATGGRFDLQVFPNGQLGTDVVRAFVENGDEAHSLSHADIEIANPASVRGALEKLQPQVIVNRFEQRMFETGLKKSDIEQALGDDLVGTIPNNYRLVREAIDRGVPLDEVKAGNSVTQALKKVLAPPAAAKSAATTKGAAAPKERGAFWAR